jgi:hypothetical protein
MSIGEAEVHLLGLVPGDFEARPPLTAKFHSSRCGPFDSSLNSVRCRSVNESGAVDPISEVDTTPSIWRMHGDREPHVAYPLVFDVVRQRIS